MYGYRPVNALLAYMQTWFLHKHTRIIQHNKTIHSYIKTYIHTYIYTYIFSFKHTVMNTHMHKNGWVNSFDKHQSLHDTTKTTNWQTRNEHYHSSACQETRAGLCSLSRKKISRWMNHFLHPPNGQLHMLPLRYYHGPAQVNIHCADHSRWWHT